MKAKILAFLKVYEEELSLLLWTAALLFIVRSSGIILNNYAETAFLKRYGVEYMPAVNMLNAVVTFFITGFLTAFLSKTSGARLLYYIFIVSGVLVTLIRLLIPFGFDLLYPLLFMLKSQFELLQAMLFWNVCNDLFNTRQSKRLFPLLTAGGVVGLILGSVGTPYFARLFNLDNLLYLYLATTLMGAVLINAMGRSYATLIFPEKSGEAPKKKPGMIEEMKNVFPLIKDSILVKIVLVLTFMPNVVIPIMNYQFNYAVNDQFASETAMIQFFGYFRGGLYMISLFILLFVGRIYGRWGLPVALMFHPFNYIIAFFGFLFQFNVFSAMYARMSTNIIRTTINVPANGILIGLFPASYRNMIRPFLRGTVVRAALFLGSSLILISDKFFHPRYLTLVALPFLFAWMAAPFILKAKYPKILRDLISNNLLDIKSMDKDDLEKIFNQEKTLSELETSFLEAKGGDALWYARLLQNFSPQHLDELILRNLDGQDEATQIALIKMISPESRPAAAHALIPFLDPRRNEATIAILKLVCQYGFEAAKGVDLSGYMTGSHPVVRGFACACLYSRDPENHKELIDDWLSHGDTGFRQSGIISAGLSARKEYIDILTGILAEDQIDAIIPDIIIALSRLKADHLNAILETYLDHEREDVRRAALDALEITDDASLRKAVVLMGDPSEDIHEFAREKIKTAEYRNNRLLVESLGMPSTRIRRGLFKLLEDLDIKDFQVLMFAKQNLAKIYDFLAMADALGHLPQGPMRNLAVEHLTEKKELVLENTIRVLAIHDQTGRMQTAWRGIFSTDTRQRANAIELLNDILDRKTFNTMLPLLESPTLETTLAEGKKVTRIPVYNANGKDAAARMLASEDWVDAIIGLGLLREKPDLTDSQAPLTSLAHPVNPIVTKEAHMILNKKPSQKTDAPAPVEAPEIPLGDKILLLKEIDIFSGLSAAELAAIASVTKELDYPGDHTVIKQNSVGETVFLIVDGKVSVIMERENGREEILDHMEGGTAFGEMALIDDSPRSATIRTDTRCRFLILHKQEFKETAMEFPRIALQICHVLSQRIRNLHALVQEKAC